MTIRERLAGWKAAAKYNERRWLLAKELEWIIATTSTVDELILEVEAALRKAK